MLCIGEEVMGAGTAEVGPADFGVGDGELSLVGGGACAHELFWGLLADMLVKGFRELAMRSWITYQEVSAVQPPYLRVRGAMDGGDVMLMLSSRRQG